MKGSTRRAEFFLVEAEEYLLDLELVASAHEEPDIERLVRGARALRGAALVAGLGTLARVAAGIEALARQLRSATIEWDTAVRQQTQSTIASLKAMLPRALTWDDAADSAALALAEKIERFAGRAPTPGVTPGAQILTSGVRSFIAKESALIATALERAARALSPVAPQQALGQVLDRMRSLRGIGASAELSPLPEMLDAMEVATRTLLGDEPPPPDVSLVFDEASRALGAMARAIADTGQVIAPVEMDRVATHLLMSYAEAPDVVAIDDLAPDGEASVLHRGIAPAPPSDAAPVPIELVGVGDHLLLVADTLDKPNTAVVRDLRLFVLHRTLASMPPRSATGQFLAPLTRAINDAIGRGVAGKQLDAFNNMLRDFGKFLIERGGAPDLDALKHERDRLVAALSQEELGVMHVAAIAIPEIVEQIETRVDFVELIDESDIVPIESLAPESEEGVAAEESPQPEVSMPHLDKIDSLEDEPVVDIATLMFEPTVATSAATAALEDLVGTPIVPIEALSIFGDHHPLKTLIPLSAPGEPGRLESAWRRQSAIASEDTAGEPSIEALTAQDILPIESLLYRGEAALLRAAELNVVISERLREPNATLALIRHELDELFDLVALAQNAA